MSAVRQARRRPRRLLQRLQHRLLAWRLIAALGALTIWLLGKSLRLTIVNNGRSDRRPRYHHGLLNILWHGRMLYLAYLYRWRGQTVLVSRSRDGELISRIVAHLGFRSVRGSTSRCAASVTRESLALLEQGRQLAITPDGPRGPARRVQPGCVYLASRSLRPLLPITFSASRALRLSSWDRFMIPFPFARVVVIYGDPIFIPAHLDEAGLDQACRQVEQVLNTLTRQADAWYSR